MLKDYQDAYGHGLYEYLTGKRGQADIVEIEERDDGYIDWSGGPKGYFNEYKDWRPYEKKAMRYAKGRVLDIGSGAGRHSLYLQGKGLDVLGIDNSPLAIEVCKSRGLRNAKVVPISQINSKLGVFDTILMLGNNFGLFGSFEGAKRLLKKFSKITSENGRIIAESNDVYKTKVPEHLSYHELNRKRGRMAGQIRLRVRYKKYATPWFDYLMVSKDEMENILDGTDWEINKFIDSDGSTYIAIIDKVKE
jgi:SAM-dependent methyltransferase